MENKRNNYLIPIIIIGIFFFILGFITWLNGILIPYLKIACELTYSQALWVASAFYISYAIMALPSSYVLKKYGFKNGMSIGLVIIAIGALIFIPAALMREYGLFLMGLFIQGTGMTILQTAINPYVTILGPNESAARRISIMGISNKVAGMIGPVVLGAIVLENIDQISANLIQLSNIEKAIELDALAGRVIVPYAIMAFFIIALAVVVKKISSLPEINEQLEDVDSTKIDKRSSIFQYPYLVLGFISIFLYVGVEVIAGDTIINYANSYWGIEMEIARYFTSLTLGGMVIGYVIGIVTIPTFIKQDKALIIFSATGVVFSILVIFTNGIVSVIFLALLGFSNSIMWPAIWPLSIDGLGKFLKTGSAILIIGIAGGALLPKVHGIVSEYLNNDMQKAYLILLPCYLFILFFASWGHKIGKVGRGEKNNL